MAGYQPSDADMEDMSPMAGHGPPKDEGTVDDQEQSPNSAVVPIALLGGHVKEGDTVTLKVLKLYGDEAELGPADEGEEGGEGDQEGGPGGSPNSELDQMDSMMG
jgi:hypothetical protein